MGLLSSKTLRQLAIGAGTQLAYRMDEARKSGEQGLEDLKVARKEVNEEVANIKKNYDSALTVGASVGGGTFANFLFGTNDIEYIAALGQMAPDNRNDAISELKKNFESLPKEERDKFEDYTKVSKQKFASDINSSKIKNGLQVTNNMGTNTTNFLSKLMFEAPKDIKEKQEAVVSGFQEPEIQPPTPVTGGYEAIRPSTSDINIDQGDILSYLKNTIDTLGFSDKEARANFEADYNTLVTGDPASKARVVQKYYYPVYQTKVPISPTSTVLTGQPDVAEDWQDYFKPNYTDTNT